MSAYVPVIDAEAKRVRLLHALDSIDGAIAHVEPGKEITGLERLRADVLAALGLISDTFGSSDHPSPPATLEEEAPVLTASHGSALPEETAGRTPIRRLFT